MDEYPICDNAFILSELSFLKICGLVLNPICSTELGKDKTMIKVIEKFPSGLTIKRARSQAKDLKDCGEVKTLTEGLNSIALQEMGLSWAKAIRVLRNHLNVDDNCDEWVFVKLSIDTAHLFHLWNRNYFKARPDLDVELEKDLERRIPLEIVENHLEYNENDFGRFCLKLGRSHNGSDGMLMPKIYFKNVRSDTKIFNNPKSQYC